MTTRAFKTSSALKEEPTNVAPELPSTEELPSRAGINGCHRPLPAGCRTAARSCELQAQADERRLEVIWEKILQQHAAEDDEYYLANLEEQCEASSKP
jgi:hypothetical protein